MSRVCCVSMIKNDHRYHIFLQVFVPEKNTFDGCFKPLGYNVKRELENLSIFTSTRLLLNAYSNVLVQGRYHLSLL